ncbi:GNAT family N-acetyltransferase [Streptomyces beijiangensis]|uniref:GNAT family N-acetyltransferase n=1 Tax=Streptomyces beijiangensis TaxID=163361 RepID=A0A939F8T2_9ACTN|nr:GNAT family N-acetyltransferase [Streptomyces beijiangensis]MBO0514018.1 GNAT family N-acetyltransferase [Streptomyces beijiangensis]
MTTSPFIRPYRPEDRTALYDICVRTGHEGGDARHLYDDHDLLPSLFAAPYAELEPDLAFVADDGDRAVGYIVGTADTAAFVERFRTEWIPRLGGRYPDPAGPLLTADDQMAALLHRPERMLVPELAAHPAHLHIDLLPGHQRAGLGRALMTRFLSTLAAKDVSGVHLGMVTANTAARAFYDRVGFHVIPVPDAGELTYLGRTTAGGVA